ncbi:polyamine ABC transporter substrate-binding protein [Thiopseudomonas alkaliphila]|uniref:polyamine ABC transporter substrate-binding protein n=1 Tax=Thiopseudomonas alkaliphila TaxID=1697053 RepID=UPI00069FD31E|nr:polyamine ABC transporter substrate-binding protein [Thiopseudomonas alkaliphila]AKX53464.1 spermidine/putrescine ABC transporter substrate-binding protein [Thiopseudomonas alkaliphila]
MRVKKMNKSLLVAALGMAISAAAQAAQDGRVLHVYQWSDYTAPTTIPNFEKQSGIKVVFDVYDTNEVLEAKLLAGGSGYDIVAPSNPFLSKQIKAGAYQKLDKSKLPNWDNLNKDLLKTLELNDPGNQYSIPYLWGTIGLGYNIDKVKVALGDNSEEIIGSWDAIFKPENISKLKECGVAILDSPTEILPAALHYLGLPPDSQKAEDLKQAEELMLSIRPYVTYFHSSKYISDLASGNICVAMGYSGDLYQSKSRAEEANNGTHLGYKIPKEGAGTFFDMIGIPADAHNVDEAHAFINYLLEPQVTADLTNYLQFPNANVPATDLVNDKIRQDPGIYPSDEVMKKLYTFPDLPSKVQRAMTRSWTKIKSGK